MNSEELSVSGEIPEENLIDYSEELPDEDSYGVYEEAMDYTDEECEKIDVLEISEEEAEEEEQTEFENEDEVVTEEKGEELPEAETEEKTAVKKPAKGKGSLIFSLLIFVFCLIIFGLGAANIIAGDRAFSESENRVLSAVPELTLHSLAQGTFTDDFEAYLTDQFIFRDEILALKTFFGRLSGKKQAGGVYIGKDGYLFSKPSVFDEKKVTEITDALSVFADGHKSSRITFMLSPNSSYVNADKLPDNLSFHDQSYQIEDIKNYTQSESISWLNLSSVFMQYEDKDSLFYRTDHHWTTAAAYEAFTALMAQWEKDISAVNFKLLPVADGFQGTLSSNSGVHSSSDTVEICVPESSALTYVVTFDGQDEKKATLFDETKLSGKNKYEVFLGGNYGKLVIDTVSESKDTLLIVKDSYANCMIPMFTPFFSKIVVIDPRYFTESLSETADEYGFTHILFLYNLNTLLEDSDLAQCLGK